MQRARAMTPSASATKEGSPFSSVSVMYAAIACGVSRYSAGSKGLVFTGLIGPPLQVVLRLRCLCSASPCHRRTEARREGFRVERNRRDNLRPHEYEVR